MSRSARPLRCLEDELGARVLNYIMDLSTFAAVAAACSALQDVARDPAAWDSREVTVANADWTRTIQLGVMMPSWRLLKTLYLDCLQGHYLYGRVLCPAAWIWNFDLGDCVINPDTNPQILISHDIVPPGALVEFTMSFWGYLPCFDAGWATPRAMEPATHLDPEDYYTNGRRLVRFRTVRPGVALHPRADRAYWVDADPITEESAIRLPIRNQEFGYLSRVTIGLEWTRTSVYIYFDGQRHVRALPNPICNLPVRHPIVVIHNGRDYRDLVLTPLPIRRFVGL